MDENNFDLNQFLEESDMGQNNAQNVDFPTFTDDATTPLVEDYISSNSAVNESLTSLPMPDFNSIDGQPANNAVRSKLNKMRRLQHNKHNPDNFGGNYDVSEPVVENVGIDDSEDRRLDALQYAESIRADEDAKRKQALENLKNGENERNIADYGNVEAEKFENAHIDGENNSEEKPSNIDENDNTSENENQDSSQNSPKNENDKGKTGEESKGNKSGGGKFNSVTGGITHVLEWLWAAILGLIRIVWNVLKFACNFIFKLTIWLQAVIGLTITLIIIAAIVIGVQSFPQTVNNNDNNDEGSVNIKTAIISPNNANTIQIVVKNDSDYIARFGGTAKVRAFAQTLLNAKSWVVKQDVLTCQIPQTSVDPDQETTIIATKCQNNSNSRLLPVVDVNVNYE